MFFKNIQKILSPFLCKKTIKECPVPLDISIKSNRNTIKQFYIVNLTKTWLGDFLGYFSLSLGDFLTKTSEPNAIKDFFPVNTGVFLYLQEKNTDCNAINTFYLYLQEEFTDKIYRRISPVITGVFL